MAEALRRHTRILRSLMKRAFEDHDRDFYGEVAGKLRLLLLSLGRNKPLLLRLLEAHGKGLDVHVLGIPLAEFLDQSGLAVRRPDGTFVTLTNAQLINIWASQHGSAHEDWSLSEAFSLLRSGGTTVDLLQVAAAQLAVIGKATLKAAEDLLTEIGK
jgi:hypothetical protein